MNARALLKGSLRRLGPLGVVGAGLLAFCLAYYLRTLQPLEQRLVDAEAKLERLTQRRLPAQAEHEPNAAIRTVGELAAFYRKFPTEDQATDHLRRIHAAAHAFNLRLPKGEYRVDRSGNFRLTRYEFRFPLKGRYEDIQAFIGRVLRETPTLALDDIAFERAQISAADTICTVRFSLFLSKDG